MVFREFCSVVFSVVAKQFGSGSALRVFQRLLLLLIPILIAFPCRAADTDANPLAMRDDVPPYAKELNIPIYEWQCPKVPPRAVLLFIHGTTLHGGVYDTIARSLAAKGYIGFAPDLRGFGRWVSEPDNYALNHRISFFDSRADLIRLLGLINRDYPNLPIFCVGESVGANLSLWLASVAPNLIDGIAISSPCVVRRKTIEVLCPTMVVDFLKAAVNPNRKVPIAPYARRFLSESPDVIEAYLNDPKMRKTVTVYESLQSLHTNRSCLWFVEHIPSDISIIVFKGTNDRMFNQDHLSDFMKRITVSDYTLVPLEGKGHIQLETPYFSAKVEGLLTQWLNKHSETNHPLLSEDKASQSDRVKIDALPLPGTKRDVTAPNGTKSGNVSPDSAGSDADKPANFKPEAGKPATHKPEV
jgi:alpha-beta hydrolase superfamily lysophospholipase